MDGLLWVWVYVLAKEAQPDSTIRHLLVSWAYPSPPLVFYLITLYLSGFVKHSYTGTDHTREYVPLLAYAPRMQGGGSLPDQDSFSIIGATIADNFGVAMPDGTIGHSILEALR